MRTYLETFGDGPGGWYGWIDNFSGPRRLPIRDGALLSHSPWWIDYNHAPPGAGYLHMLFCLTTKLSSMGEALIDASGQNRFAEGGFPTDFTNARLTFRLKGELDGRGASVVLLVQAGVEGLVSGWALTGRPLTVSPEWSEQTIVASPDPALWKPLGARHDRTGMYGIRDLRAVLSDVNANIMLIFFPLNVVPMLPVNGDPHRLRAGRDYPVWTSKLPEGYILMDQVKIEFAGEVR